MFDEVDVYSGSGEQAARQDCDELSDLTIAQPRPPAFRFPEE